ncbi:Ceramide_glucosyltransferase [Hexamita inflata]|uniref:ceramide glucosyltransferase n=1 Tax=Hexamita inflata TaxID=28002 RepID=A0AA86V3L8_9EUKA|nr:Ceramide glucosyltransferase [Hexamita inflata]
MNSSVLIHYLPYAVLILATVILGVLFAILRHRRTNIAIPQQLATMPTLVVVLPCCGQYNCEKQYHVWDSNLSQKYSGFIDYVFVVESTLDPAYTHLLSYAQSRQIKLSETATSIGDDKCVRLVISGLSFHNTQKIHNMLFGLKQSESDYIAFVDDDIEINQFTLQSLVSGINNKCKICTGYSAEIPVVQNFTSYMVMAYRAINLLGFTSENVNYAWGGCFCVKRDDFIKYGVEQVWVDGGYSDDMSIGNLIKQAGFKITSPFTNTFQNIINCTNFRRQYWNYVQRQYFVLLNYGSQKEKVVNAIAMYQLCFGGFMVWGLVISIIVDLFNETRNPTQQFRYVDSFQIKALITAVSLVIIGYSITTMLQTIENLCNQQMQRIKQHTELNPFRASLALIFHMLCTPFMIFINIFKRHIYWGDVQYHINKGKIQKVERNGHNVSVSKSLKAYIFDKKGIEAKVKND